MNPGGNNRQERMDAVSGREDRRHRADNAWARLKKKKRRANHHRKPERVAQQREGPGGQHLADFATLSSSVVKVARS